MKLNEYFTLCYCLYFIILHYPRIFTHLSPHLYFPFPTESRPKQRLTKVRRFCFIPRLAELARAQRWYKMKTKARSAVPLWSLMARGGQGCATAGSKFNRITKQKSEVIDNQGLPIFFIVFLASFWRDIDLQSTNFLL